MNVLKTLFQEAQTDNTKQQTTTSHKYISVVFLFALQNACEYDGLTDMVRVNASPEPWTDKHIFLLVSRSLSSHRHRHRLHIENQSETAFYLKREHINKRNGAKSEEEKVHRNK